MGSFKAFDRNSWTLSNIEKLITRDKSTESQNNETPQEKDKMDSDDSEFEDVPILLHKMIYNFSKLILLNFG